jgi:hypothetical protein
MVVLLQLVWCIAKVIYANSYQTCGVVWCEWSLATLRGNASHGMSVDEQPSERMPVMA